MKKWLKEHPAGAWTALAALILLIGATVFLLIWFKDYIFTENALAIVVFSALALVCVATTLIAMGMLRKE